MNAQDLNAFAQLAALGSKRGLAFIPTLDTGTMPREQGSSMAPVNVTPNVLVAGQAVPYVNGGYPQNLAQNGSPNTQNQRWKGVNFTQPPWVQVPSCAANLMLRKAPGLAFQGQVFSGGNGVKAATYPTPSQVRPSHAIFTTY
jgi:hypothetical protein